MNIDDRGFIPDLTAYDIVLISSSAGKDSQAMMDHVVQLATAQGVRDRIVVVHADLGRAEWTGTRELAEQHAKHYGLRFEVVSRRQGDLLTHVEQRGKWPANTTRYCTSDHKRAQIRRVMTKLVTELRAKRPGLVRILSCIGFRAEESPARAKKQEFIRDTGASNGRRHVDIWYPVLNWKLGEVWARIVAAGTPHHSAYDKGMTRLSCVFCIFAPRNSLLIAGEHNPDLLAEYVRIEKKISHDFRQDQKISEIATALEAGERGKCGGDTGCWNM